MTHHPSKSQYTATFMALLVLLGLTVAIAEVDFGNWNFPIAASIASVKAALIMLVFMQVRYSPPLIGLISVTGIFFLAILLALTFADYFTRAVPSL